LKEETGFFSLTLSGRLFQKVENQKNNKQDKHTQSIQKTFFIGQSLHSPAVHIALKPSASFERSEVRMTRRKLPEDWGITGMFLPL
jgi:hypothetical protein